MPQLDIYTYGMQCFWLTIFFFFGFYYFYNFVLIRLFKVFKIRNIINNYIIKMNYDIKYLFEYYNINIINYNNILLNLSSKNILLLNILNNKKK